MLHESISDHSSQSTRFSVNTSMGIRAAVGADGADEGDQMQKTQQRSRKNKSNSAFADASYKIDTVAYAVSRSGVAFPISDQTRMTRCRCRALSLWH